MPSVRDTESHLCGFSLIELLVATAMFTVIAAATFTLYSRQQNVAGRSQNDVALNIGVRNAVSQIQTDLANAGSGIVNNISTPGWSLGLVIVNNVVPTGSSCYNATTKTYTANCFDQINVLSTDPNTPPIHPDAPTCESETSSNSFGQPATGFTLAQTTANYHTGDQLLYLKSDGSTMATVILTQDGMDAGGKVKLQHNPTATNGTNIPANDPLGLSWNANNKLGSSFCTSDWILKLAPTIYKVDSSDATNPRLVRIQGGNTDVIMDQVIGFKVGATIWNSATPTTASQYNYDASQYTVSTPADQKYNFSLIRSVRISLIARTKPSTDPSYTFRNAFDGGAYQVQGTSIVVNPRNLSMKD